MSNAVNVLLPSGRRQIVKVTMNTSISQVLEEVCNKQGFSSQDYDLRHYNKVLDLSDTIRFANLPNNAQLELVKAATSKIESLVTVALQLPSGERCLSTFNCSETLWDVLTYWKSNRSDILDVTDEEGNTLEPVCIYMRREVSGETNLKNTSLRSLGLVSGSAILRVIHRLPDKPVEQAYVEALILNKPLEEIKPSFRSTSESDDTDWDQPFETSDTTTTAAEKSSPELTKMVITDKVENKEDCVMIPDEMSGSDHQSFPDGIESTNEAFNCENHKEDKLNFLDDKGTLVFNLNEDTTDALDFPDNFYDTTIGDVKYLQSDLKRKSEEYENEPLRTSAMREKERVMLNNLKQYPVSLIRIRFPDELVLQGRFEATDNVEKVMEFVRSFLADENEEFQLYLPPQIVLKPDEKVYEAGLFSKSVVIFRSKTHKDHHLREDVRMKVSSADAVKNAIARIKEIRSETGEDKETARKLVRLSAKDERRQEPERKASPGNVSCGAECVEPPVAPRVRPSQGVIPKWFVMGKK